MNTNMHFCWKKLLMFVFCLSLTCSCASGIHNIRTYNAKGRFGAVATGHPLATKAARNVLANGGNAVDAAVCAALVLGVTDLTNSSLGGDGYALVRTPNGSVLAWDASIKKPLNNSNNKSEIGIPTEPMLLFRLLKTYGSRSMAELMAPAIRIAKNGFKVSSYLEQVVKKRLLKLSDKRSINLFYSKGHPILSGEVLKQPDLAKTLIEIAKNGINEFYRGSLAKIMVKHIQSLGSTYTLEDFANYRCSPEKPISQKIKNYKLIGVPPPSCSIVAIAIIKELVSQNIELYPKSLTNIEKVASVARNIINIKHYKLASCIKDPGYFYQLCKNQNTPTKISKEFESNTTHLCTWDKNGMVVSMTLTLGSHCGTGQLSPLGFFYNNEMRNYKNFIAKYPNDYPKNAGPISSKAPLIVLKDNKPFLAIGGAGSNRIIANVALIAARAMTDEDSLEKAIHSPRYFLDYKNRLYLEWSSKLNDLLKNSSKNNFKKIIKEAGSDYFGLVTGIIKEANSLRAIADFRRDGAAAALRTSPETPRKFKVRLFVSKNRSFRNLKISNANSSAGQHSSIWKCLNKKAHSHYNNNNTCVSFPSDLNSATFKANFEILPIRRTTLQNNKLEGTNIYNYLKQPKLGKNIRNYISTIPRNISDYELIQWLMTDVGFNFKYKATKGVSTAEDLFKNMSGDCSGKARLIDKVLRHFHIPSRLVGGVITKSKLSSKTHIWNEAYINGQWLPICSVNHYFGHIPSNWIILRYGDKSTIDKKAKLIFEFKEVH